MNKYDGVLVIAIYPIATLIQEKLLGFSFGKIETPFKIEYK